MRGILAATRRELESRYHSDSSINSSDSDCSEGSSTSFAEDTDCSLPDYSFDAATYDMTWDLIPSPPKSPPARRPSRRRINQNYHIFCHPKMSQRDIFDLSPIRERRECPQQVKIFDDEASADAQPLPSDSFSSFNNCSPESMAFNCHNDFDTFGSPRASTPTIEPAPIRPAKRRLSFNNKENETPEKRRRDNNDAGDPSVNQAVIIRQYCEFCFANAESPLVYTFHTLTDKKGRTLCPVLRQIECPICNADGDHAHTTERCPQLNHQQEMQPLGQHNSRQREQEARDRDHEGNNKLLQPLGRRSPQEVQRATKRPAPERNQAGVRHVRRKLTLLQF